MAETRGTMNVALVGLGMVSGTYVDALADLAPAVTLRGVLAQSRDSGTRFLEANRARVPEGCRPYASIADIAGDRAIDFVIVATPPNARLEIVEPLARAGKPILMEKPVERSVSAAEALCALCETHSVPLGVTLQHRARPVVATLLERRQSADAGPLVAVEATIPWWRPQSYYDEPGRGTYARDGGGVLISQAIHTLDLMLHLSEPVKDVMAQCSTTPAHAMEAEDFVTAGLRFSSGASGAVFASTASFPGQTERIVLHYQTMTMRLEGDTLSIHHRDGREEALGTGGATGAGADPMAFTSDWHRRLIEDFCVTVRTGRPPLAPARSALAVHRLIAAIEQSSREGRRVSLEGNP